MLGRKPRLQSYDDPQSVPAIDPTGGPPPANQPAGGLPYNFVSRRKGRSTDLDAAIWPQRQRDLDRSDRSCQPLYLDQAVKLARRLVRLERIGGKKLRRFLLR